MKQHVQLGLIQHNLLWKSISGSGQMTTYIAFLRGINVGGKNMINMAVLKQMFEAMGIYQLMLTIS